MIRLTNALKAWGTQEFNDILKKEMEQMGGAQLPLQEGLKTSSYALDNKLQVMINSALEDDNCIRVKAGIFYFGIIPGCSCADDPTPDTEYNEYCEVELNIDKSTAETTIREC